MARPPRGLLAVLLVNFVDTLGFSILLPFLVFLVRDFGGNAFAFGALSAVYPLFQLLSAAPLGRWSDRFGRKRVLVLCEAGTALGWALFALALRAPRTPLITIHGGAIGPFVLSLPLALLFVARAADGLTGGNSSVANAYLADISPAGDRNRHFGQMGISSNLGLVAGPAVAGVLGGTRFGYSLPVLVALATSLLALALVFPLPEPDPCLLPGAPGPGQLARAFGREIRSCVLPESLSWSATLAIPYMWRTLALYFLIYLGFSFYYAGFPVLAAEGWNWTVGETGAYFAFLSLAMVAVQGPLLSAASKRFSEPMLIVLFGLVTGVSFLLLLHRSPPLLVASVLLFAVGNGLMWPSVVSTLSRVAGERAQGAAQGLAGSAGALASVIGLVAGGLTYQHLGARTMALAAGFIVAGSLTAIPLLRLRIATE